MIKEACVEGFTQAIRAQQLGADRIELCENLAEGGTTPSVGTVLTCKKYLHIPVIVMIRPRGGNFIYTMQEIEIMLHDIEACVSAGADGIAVGLLTSRNEIDLTGLDYLVKRAGNLQITFHKAIDTTYNILNEFIRLRDSGLVHRVLTSGGADTAAEGAEVLKKMISISNGNPAILVAGKVTSENLGSLSTLIPAEEFHGKKIVGELDIRH